MRKGTNLQSRKLLGLFPLRTHGNYYTLSNYLWEWPKVYQKGFYITKEIKEGPQWRKQVRPSHGLTRIRTSNAVIHSRKETAAAEVLLKEKGLRSPHGVPQPGNLHQKKTTSGSKSQRGVTSRKPGGPQDCSWKASWLFSRKVIGRKGE